MTLKVIAAIETFLNPTSWKIQHLSPSQIGRDRICPSLYRLTIFVVNV